MSNLSQDDLQYGTARRLVPDSVYSVGESGEFNLQPASSSSVMTMTNFAGGDGSEGGDAAECEEALDNCIEDKAELIELLNVRNDALRICNAALEACAADLLAANQTTLILQGKLDELCDQQPPSGSWSVNRGVFYSTSSGSCSSFKYYGHQFNTATLSQTLKFLGGSLGNGYPIVNTSSTITALYQVDKSNGAEELPPNPVNSDGTFPCMFIYGNIQLKKYNPSTGLYGSSQAGIPSGANGIGEYGVFHRTNYAWSDGSTLNPYQIGTITKETSADEFLFDTTNDPCAE